MTLGCLPRLEPAVRTRSAFTQALARPSVLRAILRRRRAAEGSGTAGVGRGRQDPGRGTTRGNEGAHRCGRLRARHAMRFPLVVMPCRIVLAACVRSAMAVMLVVPFPVPAVVAHGVLWE